MEEAQSVVTIRTLIGTMKGSQRLIIVPPTKRMVVARVQRKNGAQWPMQSYDKQVSMVPPATFPLQLQVGPIFINVKLISFINRQAWSKQQQISSTHLRSVSNVVNSTLAGPKLPQANWATRGRNVLAHLVLNPMGFEPVKR